jgi:hypothetical protein
VDEFGIPAPFEKLDYLSQKRSAGMLRRTPHSGGGSFRKFWQAVHATLQPITLLHLK